MHIFLLEFTLKTELKKEIMNTFEQLHEKTGFLPTDAKSKVQLLHSLSGSLLSLL